MLSENAAHVAAVLREIVGADKKGIGPDAAELLAAVNLDAEQLRDAITELANIGFVQINRCAGLGPSKARALAGIMSITVLEPMQGYLDMFE